MLTFTSVSFDTSTSTFTKVQSVNTFVAYGNLQVRPFALSRCCCCRCFRSSLVTNGWAGRNLRWSHEVPHRGSISQSALRLQITFPIETQRRVNKARILAVSEQKEWPGHGLVLVSDHFLRLSVSFCHSVLSGPRTGKTWDCCDWLRLVDRYEQKPLHPQSHA